MAKQAVTMDELLASQGDDVDPEKVFTLNERKEFIVLAVEKDNRKISLSLSKKIKTTKK